jgi:hypothetical protein
MLHGRLDLRAPFLVELRCLPGGHQFNLWGSQSCPS